MKPKTQILIAALTTLTTILLISAVAFGQTAQRPQANPKTRNPIIKQQDKPNTQKTVLVTKVNQPIPYKSLVKKTASVEKTTVNKPTIAKLYSTSSNILITKEAQPLLEQLSSRYFEKTGKKLHITSGFRPPARQASAMLSLLKRYGAGYVLALYKNPAISQVVQAYLQNRGNGKALQAMIAVIENQVRNNVFLSDHQIEKAFDVRLTANGLVLRQVVQELGGRLLRETDHYHVEF